MRAEGRVFIVESDEEDCTATGIGNVGDFLERGIGFLYR